MVQLFSKYSVSEIILFIVILSLALRRFVEFIDWLKKRTKQAVQEADAPALLQKAVQKQSQELLLIKTELDSLKKSINLLIASDKDDIRQALTRDHHYFCYTLHSIDDYSLDCMERRYSHYTQEGGNSYVHTLMQDVRALPKVNNNQPTQV